MHPVSRGFLPAWRLASRRVNDSLMIAHVIVYKSGWKFVVDREVLFSFVKSFLNFFEEDFRLPGMTYGHLQLPCLIFESAAYFKLLFSLKMIDR